MGGANSSGRQKVAPKAPTPVPKAPTPVPAAPEPAQRAPSGMQERPISFTEALTAVRRRRGVFSVEPATEAERQEVDALMRAAGYEPEFRPAPIDFGAEGARLGMSAEELRALLKS